MPACRACGPAADQGQGPRERKREHRRNHKSSRQTRYPNRDPQNPRIPAYNITMATSTPTTCCNKRSPSHTPLTHTHTHLLPQSTSDSKPTSSTPLPHAATNAHVPVAGSHTPDAQSADTRHELAPGQDRPHTAPPSTHASAPFLTPSTHEGAAHVPPKHTSDPQSLCTVQPTPTSHMPQAPPPQSTPVSAPLRRPSLQEVFARHSPSGLHTPLLQSPPTTHVDPAAQRGAAVDAPPQSTPDSSPFCTPSVDVGRAQEPRVHTPDPQSALRTHRDPTRHWLHTPPPQSTPASPPLRTPSPQEGAAQTPFTQSWDAQSPLVLHTLPVAHPTPHTSPPSTQTSPPFLTPSEQLCVTK